MLQENPPAILDQLVLLDDPMKDLPLLSLRFLVADSRDPRSVVPFALVAAEDRVAGRSEHEHNAGMAVVRQVRRVVIAIGQAVKRGLVADKHVLIGRPEPEAVAAVVGLVTDPSVPRRPGFDAVVVGVGAVVLFKVIVGADPAVEDPDEDAASA